MYSELPSLRATYLDGGFPTTSGSDQPNILVVGPASTGRTNQRFNVVNISNAEREFGASSPLLRVVHEAFSAGADNISTMRSGGRKGVFVLEDSNGETLTIIPEQRDDEVLQRFALFISNDGVSNRIVIRDQVRDLWVYDSENLLAQDIGDVDVDDSGIELMDLNDLTDPLSAVSLGGMVVGDVTPPAAALIQQEGEDGLDASLAERYAALQESYHLLDYKDADFIIPVDVFIDAPNIADEAPSTFGEYWAGVPEAGTEQDKLGFVWHLVERGHVYTYITDTQDYFSVTPVAASVTVDTDITVTAAPGKGGNACTIEIDDTVGTMSVVISKNSNGGLSILVEEAGGENRDDVQTAINLALAAVEVSPGVLGSDLITVSGASAVPVGPVPETALTDGAGGHVLTHEMLTGDVVPASVSARFASGDDQELREANFAHQLASHCFVSSTNWKALHGVISFAAPEAFSRIAVSEHIGEPPRYIEFEPGKFKIESPADNGTGLFANKLIAGKADSAGGYRSGMVPDGIAASSYGFGGLILTRGRGLPNGPKFPYGIDDTDEAIDERGKPVDIGKHIFITFDYPIHANRFDGRSRYRGSIVGTFAGKLATMPVFEEPIGLNGAVPRISQPLRIHASQLNQLAGTRLIGFRNDDAFGLTFSSARTAAHPIDSDYTRGSTARCVTRLVGILRDVARPYIGKEFTAARTASLQQAIDGAIFAERQEGTHDGAIARVLFNPRDQILGRLRIQLRMRPPFTIQEITTEISLVADESEL